MKQKYQQRKTRRGWETSVGWKMAVAGAVLAAGLATGEVAGAQGPVSNAPMAVEDEPAPQGTAAVVREYHIAAGALGDALDAFRAQSGAELKLELTGGQLAGFKTNGVSGSFTKEAALHEILAGTGLNFGHAGAETLTVGLRHSESVDVTANAIPSSVAMGKFTESLIDTPQTVAVVPQFILHDEQNRSLTDAIRNVPGISIAAGESGAQGDNLTIRGFTARNDIFLDGIRDFGSYYRDSFNFDQVEVLEGPAGVQFGRGSTGGVINQESKVPAADKFVHVTAQIGTDLTRRLSADINEPLNDVVQGAAFRLNVVATEGGVAGRPFAENRRYGIAPSLTFGLNSNTRATISYFHFTENDTPDYGLPWFFNGLAPGVSRHSYFGFPSTNYLRAHDDILTMKANHSFSGNVDLHTIGRWANYARDVQITEPQICSNASISVPVGGYVTALPTSSVTGGVCAAYGTVVAHPSAVTVNRNQLQIKSVEAELWEQTELTARFKVFGIRNDFAGGAEGGRETSNPIRTSYGIKATSSAPSLNTVPATNLVTPNAADVFSGTGYVSGVTHLTSRSAGVYFVDTVHLGRFFEASGGVRWDLFDTVVNLYAPATSVVGASLTAAIKPTEQKVTQPTYRAAVVFKPNSHGSVYFDYGTSFNPSAESLALSVLQSVLPPEENETYEAGAKYSLMRERLKVEAAWFRTEKDNARETDPTNSNNIQLSGNQAVQGIQTSAVGRLAGGTDLVVGYAYLSSHVLSSLLFPSSVGYELANVPKQTFNAFLTHNLPFRLSAGWGGNYVASRTASSSVPYVPLTFSAAQTFAAGTAPCGTATSPNLTTCYQVLSTAMKQVPGYWVFNVMVKRPITDRLELQANVYNVLNRFYIDQPHPSHLIPGAGINALIGVNFKF